MHHRDRRSIWIRSSWLVGLTLAIAMSFGAVARAQDPADIATARHLFKEGAELSRKGDWEAAADRFTRSLSIKKTPLTLYSLGVAQKNVGRLAEALESFRAFLAEPAARASEPFEQPARDAIAELERRVAHLHVVVLPADAPGLAIVVDEVPVPAVAHGRPRLVNPGAHEVTVAATGYQDVRREVTVAEGATEEVRIELEPMPEPPAPAPDLPEDDLLEDLTEPPFPEVPVALMASGVAVAAVGIGVGLMGVYEVPETGSPDDPAVDSARAKAIAGDVLAGVGAVTAAVGLVLLVVELTGSDEREGESAWIHAEGVGFGSRF
jgi:hypothetical protein